MAKKQKTKLQKKRKSFLIELIILTIIKYILLFAPIVCVIIYFRDVFFTYKEGLSVSIGGILALVCAILLMKHQVTIFKGIGKFAIIFLLCLLLNSIMQEAVYISAALLVGYFLSMWFTAPISRRKELIAQIDKAQIQAEAMADVTLSVNNLV